LPTLESIKRRSGLDIANRYLPGTIELPLLTLMLRVKMPRLVFTVVHSDHNAEEDRNDRHPLSIASPLGVVGPTWRMSRATS